MEVRVKWKNLRICAGVGEVRAVVKAQTHRGTCYAGTLQFGAVACMGSGIECKVRGGTHVGSGLVWDWAGEWWVRMEGKDQG